MAMSLASSRAFTRRGDLRGAVAGVREARATAPYDSSLHAYGASLLLKAGLYDEAVEWARFAVTHDANPPQPYFDTLFDAYYASRRMQEAVDLAEMQIQKPSPREMVVRLSPEGIHGERANEKGRRGTEAIV
jgi:hypothetical protein